MYDVATVLQPVSHAIDAKLGRCARCIRLSAAATVGSWGLFGVAALTGSAVGQALALVGAVPLAMLSLAHGIAFLVREPVPNGGCTPCQRKARERARQARRRRIKAWFSAPRRRTSAPKRGCTGCQQPLSQQELIDQADRLPAANGQILDVIQASPEFQHLTPLLVQSRPVDSWMADMRHHFVFELRPTRDGHSRHALFAARWEDYGLASALLVTQDGAGGETIVTCLRSSSLASSTLD